VAGEEAEIICDELCIGKRRMKIAMDRRRLTNISIIAIREEFVKKIVLKD